MVRAQRSNDGEQPHQPGNDDELCPDKARIEHFKVR